jgi:hypothetical protein
MNRTKKIAVAGALLAAGLVAGGTATLRAADHIDYPDVALAANNKVDIADFYAFDNGTNAVLIMTFAPLAAAGSNNGFDDTARYEFNLDTSSPLDGVADKVYKVRTRGTDVRVLGGNVDMEGAIDAELTQAITGGTAKFWAGAAEDPFFIDLAGVQAVLEGSGGLTGNDTTINTNVSAFVLEVPKVELGSGPMGAWVSVRR